MGIGSNEYVEMMERDPKNWTTLKCSICGENYKYFKGHGMSAMDFNAQRCPDCVREETGFK